MVTRTYGGPIIEGGTAGQSLVSNATTPPTFATKASFLTGTGAPASGTGSNGDVYLDTATSNLYGPKASGAWPAATSLIGGANSAPVSGVIATLSATWAASGTAVSWTVPSTVNGQTVTKLVVIDVITRLLTGTPGTAATYGLSISGNTPYSSRALPTQGGGVDVGLMNLNVNNLSGTFKMANAGDTITVTSGGTFSGSTTWAIDIFGYYVGLSPGAPLQGVEFNFQGCNTVTPGASATWAGLNAMQLPEFWIAPAAGYVRSISGYIGTRASGNPGGGAYLAVLKNQTYTTNGSSAMTVNGTNIAQTALVNSPGVGVAAAYYSNQIFTTGNSFAAGDRLLPVLISNASMTGSYPVDFSVNVFVQMTAL